MTSKGAWVLIEQTGERSDDGVIVPNSSEPRGIYLHLPDAINGATEVAETGLVLEGRSHSNGFWELQTEWFDYVIEEEDPVLTRFVFDWMEFDTFYM